MVAPARQYTILQSAGLSGTTFAALATQNLPAGFNATLGYTADNVLLNINAVLGADAGLNGNQQSVASGLNNFYNNGGTLPANFATVFGLSGPSLANTLSQLSGEVAVDAKHGAFQMMTQFLGLMLDPFVDGRLGGGNGQAMGFAPDEQAALPPDIALAYAAILKKAPARPTFDQRWTAWGARPMAAAILPTATRPPAPAMSRRPRSASPAAWTTTSPQTPSSASRWPAAV